MRNFAIVTDSSCDTPVDIIEKYDVRVVPMCVTVNDKTCMHHYDFREMSNQEFCEALKNGAKGSTAGTNMQDAYNVMKEVAMEGKDIIFLSISSGLSCSYQNACLAAEDIKDEFPDIKVAVIDTKSVCVGVGLLIVHAAIARENGRPFDEVVNMMDEYRYRVHHHFTVNDLEALSRSGRISHMTAAVGSLLNIKPMLYIDNEGKVQSEGKARGRKAAVKQIINQTLLEVTDSTVIMIAHADALADAETVKAALLEKLPHSEIIIGDIGPIIGIHTGHQTLAVICLGEKR